MNILITGVQGQLGSEIRAIASDYPEHRFFFASRSDLNISDSKALETYLIRFEIEAVINCAAYTAVDKAEEEEELAKEINFLAVKNIDRCCTDLNIRYIHISTDYVFDGTNHLPYREEDRVNPIGVYGQSKRLGEEVVLNSKADALVIRTAWVYSEYGNNFVKTMLRLGNEKESLKVVFDQVGTPTHAADLAKTCIDLIILSEPMSSKNRLYHYANEGVCSWYDFALSIMEIAGLSCKILPIESDEYPTKAKRPHFSVLNKARIKADFNLEIPHWRSALKNCLQKKSIV